MQTTRSRVLIYLENHPRSSAREISRYLKMTPANIRYHLGILTREGWIQVSDQRSPGGAGRPISLYTLTSDALGNNFHPLLQAVLEWIGSSSAAREDLREIARRMAGEGLADSLNRVQRFNLAVEHLNAHDYHASWEARPEGPQVSLRHCPYQSLPETHPLICQLDEELLSALCGTRLVLTLRRSFGKDPLSPCQFNPPERLEEKGSEH